jgi:hypothetical protein
MIAEWIIIVVTGDLFSSTSVSAVSLLLLVPVQGGGSMRT